MYDFQWAPTHRRDENYMQNFIHKPEVIKPFGITKSEGGGEIILNEC
jgi:hypothetical protein